MGLGGKLKKLGKKAASTVYDKSELDRAVRAGKKAAKSNIAKAAATLSGVRGVVKVTDALKKNRGKKGR